MNRGSKNLNNFPSVTYLVRENPRFGSKSTCSPNLHFSNMGHTLQLWAVCMIIIYNAVVSAFVSACNGKAEQSDNSRIGFLDSNCLVEQPFYFSSLTSLQYVKGDSNAASCSSVLSLILFCFFLQGEVRRFFSYYKINFQKLE